MRDWLQRAWYSRHACVWLLWPLSLLFRSIAGLRRTWLKSRAVRLAVPVIVVGNISVGGTGKTPLIIALVKSLRREGWRPGVISRGYGARPPEFPYPIAPDDSPDVAGDEPLLIARQTGCPVVIDPDRVRAGQHLLNHTDCNLILSDDGLQHYRLYRDIELAVIDGQRGVGNGFCLPAGPLREPVHRLSTVDFLVVNGSLGSQLPVDVERFAMSLQPGSLLSLTTGQSCQATDWPYGRKVHGVAGIGHPERFWLTLTNLGFEVVPHPFPDHHAFRPADIRFDDPLPVIMTAKDAVKCATFATENCWQLPVDARLDEALVAAICQRLRRG